MHKLSSLFLLAVTPAFAPAHAAGDDPPLETIVVTASRIPLPLEQAGSSVTVIDRDQIDRRQAVFVTDLLQDVPGVALRRSGGIGSQTQVRVRGAEANQVLVMIDGVRANDPAGNDEFPFQDLTTWDVAGKRAAGTFHVVASDDGSAGLAQWTAFGTLDGKFDVTF